MALRIHSAASAAAVSVPPVRPVTLHPEAAAGLLPGPGTELLQHDAAVAITTGQQPGLFGGPLYTVHKALAARAIARELEHRLQRPVVPVFWLAGYDHDWAEATHAAWWTLGDDVRSWALPPRDSSAPQRAMSHEPLPAAAVQAARHRLADDLPAGRDRDAALAWVDRHWRSGATVASAFAGAMNELLAPLGIACFDATAPGVARGQIPVIRAALDDSDRIDAALAARGDAGTGIAAGDRATLVFIEGAAGRDRLVRSDDQHFVTRRSGERYHRDQLEDLLQNAPERFSPNVLLRPVVEAALLPTLAYVAGPGEARYLTRQADLVYPLLGVVPQQVIPRWSGWVIDPTTDRLLSRVGLSAAEVIAADRDTERRLLRQDMPPAVTDALAGLAAASDAAIAALRPEAATIDPVLDRALTGRERRLRHLHDDIQRLMERHLKKRDDIAWGQFQRLRRRLQPLGQPQERVITVAAAWGRWGSEWLDRAAEAADAWARHALEPMPRSP